MNFKTLLSLCALMVTTFGGWLGAQNNFLHFDGQNDYVTLNLNTNAPAMPNLTFEAWILYETGSSTPTRHIFGNDNGGWDRNLILSGSQYAVVFNGPIGTGVNATPGVWEHVAMVQTPSRLELHINGNLVWSQNGSFTTTNGDVNTRLGQTFPPGGGNHSYKGGMDEIRVWNTARTSAEIQASMNNGISGNEPGLVAYYTFNQATCGGANPGETVLIDQTGNGANGTLENFALNGCTSNWVCATPTCPYPDNGVAPLVSTVPTLSEWGLLILALLLLNFGAIAIWRRQFSPELA